MLLQRSFWSRAALLALFLLPTLTAAQPVHRTLLLELTDIDRNAMPPGLSVFEDYGGAVVSHVGDQLLLLATPAERAVLAERGLSSTVLREDTSLVALYKRALYGPTMAPSPVYHTYAQVLGVVDSLVRAHPDRIRRFRIGASTQENQDIFAVQLGGDLSSPGTRPVIQLNGPHHADEIVGVEILTEAMIRLVSGYGRDPDLTRWMDTYDFYVVPVVNPDGHRMVTHGHDPRWRKNTRDTNGDGVIHEYGEGIDLNRNYDFNWAHGGSNDSTSGRYRGEHPFSEAENRAMRSLVERVRPMMSLSYHSQGEVVYYPWDWRGRHAPDDRLLTSIARDVAGSIRTMRGDTTYIAHYGAGTVGQSYPWLYGRYGTFDMVVEVGLGSHVFPAEVVPGLVEANLPGIWTLLRRGEGPGACVTVTDAATGAPVQAEVWVPSIETEDVDRRRTNTLGRMWRLLEPGAHSLHISAGGYAPVIRTVDVGGSGWTCTEVRLVAEQ